jgi:Domain of unknown function (DUF4276)
MLGKLLVFVEEQSMETALEHLLPKLLDGSCFEIRRFQCKDDLLKNLPVRLKGYSGWLPSDWVILVIIDRDDDDSLELKGRLEEMAHAAGLTTKSRAKVGSPFQVINRLAIEELEAWFFGDWAAVKGAYPRISEAVPRRAAFREPDAIRGGTWEALERVMKNAGYFKTGLRKVECARAISQRMDPAKNSSRSFRALVRSLTRRPS